MKWLTHFWRAGILLVGFAVVAAAQTTNLLPNGGFESGKPSLFTAQAGASGATLTWASDQVHNGTRSLKIVKAGTADSARWVSANNCRYWVVNVPKTVDIKLGAWVKTSGVNTSPVTAADKWQVKFTFYDTLGVIIGAPVALDVDQSIGTKDWYADTNAVGSVILPKDAYKLIISAVAGKNATGTVWFDDFIFTGRAGAWAGQNWNGFVDADSGWQYWIAPNGGNDGLTYFPASGVTTAQAHSGTSSLKIAGTSGRGDGELVWFTETVPVTAGKQYVLSAWVMTSGIKKDSVFNAESQLGFTWTYHSQMFTDNGDWKEVAGGDYRFTLKDTSTNWTQYQVILTVPNGASAVSVRARSWHLWYGTSYWDDFALQQITAVGTGVEESGPHTVAGGVPTEYILSQNFPNPFNPSTMIQYSIPQAGNVRLEVFNILGQQVAMLVNEAQSAGKWTVRWNGVDNTGAKVATGLYLYRLTTPSTVLSRKMLLLK
ncbi:MAG: carbohydrate binding domain-containing protein [Bacteroidota bacterium]